MRVSGKLIRIASHCCKQWSAGRDDRIESDSGNLIPMAKKKSAKGVALQAQASSPSRPEVGTQAQFQKKPPQTYRYVSSLSPALDWDGQNAARERGERH